MHNYAHSLDLEHAQLYKWLACSLNWLHAMCQGFIYLDVELSELHHCWSREIIMFLESVTTLGLNTYYGGDP